jgi:DNA-binding CsgD family transcriptional regulator
MPQLDAALFNRKLRHLSSPEQCGVLFSQAIAPLGFDTFASGEVDFQNRDRSAFHIIGWPQKWRDFYVRSGLIERDPVVDELRHWTQSFTWADLRAERKLAKVGREALDMCAEAGWCEGFVVPLRQSSHRVGLVSMAGNRLCTDPDERDYLTLISICLHSHVRTLVATSGFALSPAGLTDREVACVRLAATGMTDLAIAEALGIAASTAHEFIEKAKRRMNVRSRTQLAGIAGALGIADI